jgi:penicillin-binding protein 1C
VAAAAQVLFGKDAARLDPREVALLVALLPNPAADPRALAARACRLMPGDCPALGALAQGVTDPMRLKALGPGLARIWPPIC